MKLIDWLFVGWFTLTSFGIWVAIDQLTSPPEAGGHWALCISLTLMMGLFATVLTLARRDIAASKARNKKDS